MSKSVLMICTGNVCRSPMAEGLLRKLVEDAGYDIRVDSAGVGAMNGIPPSSNSVTAMEKLDIDISDQRSAMMTPAMVGEYTYIFGMAKNHIDVIRAYFPACQEKTFILREFITQDEDSVDVPDPIGCELDEYYDCLDLIVEAMPSVLQFVATGELPG